MNRMTRPLNSVELRELLRSLSLRASSTKLRFSQATRPLSHVKHFTPSKPLDFSSFGYNANRSSFKPGLPEIDTKPAELDPPSVEDLNSVENPDPNPNFVVVAEVSTDYNNMDDVSRSKGPDSSERRNADLPEELSKKVVHLSCESSAEGGKCDVYLVGTCHASKARSCSGFCLESCREVEAVISYLKPQVVFLELCPSRIGVLHARDVKDVKVPSVGEMVEMWRRNEYSMLAILHKWFLAVIARLGLVEVPMSEFRVACEEAKKYGARVFLGDRPIHLNHTDHIGNMRARLLTLFETLVDERDQYMSCTLLAVAGEHTSVVAVVGMGHLPGIQKYWKQPVPINELMTIPPQKPTSAAFAIAIASAFAIAFVFVCDIDITTAVAIAIAIATAFATSIAVVLVIEVVHVICR
ncbi:hypothetical protein V6N11_028138 [Hibiscus sabdariffa]|uniref:TraB family protein n=1 Tax=Hibiscus sabdariffa TaxID=183260 RepID=A0ABR2NZU0_9ROSI